MQDRSCQSCPEYDFVLRSMEKTFADIRCVYAWYVHGPSRESNLIRDMFSKDYLLPSLSSWPGSMHGPSFYPLPSECDPLKMSPFCSSLSVVPHGTQRRSLTCFGPWGLFESQFLVLNKDSLLSYCPSNTSISGPLHTLFSLMECFSSGNLHAHSLSWSLCSDVISSKKSSPAFLHGQYNFE